MFAALKSLFPKGGGQSAKDCILCKKQGDEHLKQNRLDDAATCYRRALSMDPNHVDTLVALGFVMNEQKRYPEAEQTLRHALSIDPRNADAHYLLGTMAKRGNDVALAIDHYTRALEQKPDFAFAYRDIVTALSQSGQLEKAKDVLGRAVAALPGSAEFRFYLGNVLCAEGDYDGAIARYREALSIAPASAQTHKNLADALSKRGAVDESVAAYRKAVWFAPNLFDAQIGLGNLLQQQGGFDEAIASFQRAVTLKPDHAGAQVGLGNALESRRRQDEAIVCYRRAIALEPTLVAAHQYLGNALLESGATQEAAACYEEVVRLDPDNPVKHLVAALSGGDSERAPGAYVERLFDDYAQQFDAHLVQSLGYGVPEQLADLLRPYAAAEGEKWRVLDLGCGTGLSGAAIAPYARQLVGVDLSTKMLEKARARNLYQRLEHGDLSTMMVGEPSGSYDLVFATDVFIYLGKLDALVHEAQRLLRPGGLFAFSVESLEALIEDAAPAERKDYRLNVTGRYAHSIEYLARLARDSDFEILGTTKTQSRIEKGKPVEGYLGVWRRRAGPRQGLA